MWWRMRSSSSRTFLEIYLPHWRKSQGEKVGAWFILLKAFFLKGSFANVVNLLPALLTQKSGSSHGRSPIPVAMAGDTDSFGDRGPGSALLQTLACWGPRAELPVSIPSCLMEIRRDVFRTTEAKRSQSCVIFCTGFFSLPFWYRRSLSACKQLFYFVAILLTGRQTEICFSALL